MIFESRLPMDSEICRKGNCSARTPNRLGWILRRRPFGHDARIVGSKRCPGNGRGHNQPCSFDISISAILSMPIATSTYPTFEGSPSSWVSSTFTGSNVFLALQIQSLGLRAPQFVDGPLAVPVLLRDEH